MMTVTIVKDVDQWFVALSVKGPEQQQQPIPLNDKAVGVDLEVTNNIITLNDGTLIKSPKFLDEAEGRAGGFQRALSRKRMALN